MMSDKDGSDEMQEDVKTSDTTSEQAAAMDPSAPQMDGGRLEKVLDLRFDGTTVTARVISTGCTGSSDFHVEYEIGEGVCLASLLRHKPDLCRKAPEQVSISVDWLAPEECRELEIRFTNEFLSVPASQFSRTPGKM